MNTPGDNGIQPAPRLQLDSEGRVWPQLSRDPPKQASKSKPDARLEKLTSDLADRDLQIAELTGAQLAQNVELREACEQIDLLTATIESLRQEGDRRDLDLATTTQKLIQTENDNAELHAQLAVERGKSVTLSERLLEVESAFNDRLVDVTAHRETAERLAAELADARAATPRAVADAEAKAHRLFAERRTQLSERHAQRVHDLQSVVIEREAKIAHLENTHAEFAALFYMLSDQIAALETEKHQAAETIRKLTGQIEILETKVTVERQNAEATIKELVAEFGREREKQLAREQAAAEIRKNIVQLLPKLIARREAPAAQVA